MSSLGGSISCGNRSLARRPSDRLVHRQGGLGQPHHPRRVLTSTLGRALKAVDQADPGRGLAGRADDLLMALVADQQDVVVLAANRRASLCTLVTSGQVASMCRRPRCAAASDLGGDAMRREDDDAALRAPRRSPRRRWRRVGQVADHMRVVHDLLAHVYRGAKPLQRHLDSLHGAIDPCAVATWLCQQDPAVGLRHASHVRRDGTAADRGPRMAGAAPVPGGPAGMAGAFCAN